MAEREGPHDGWLLPTLEAIAPGATAVLHGATRDSVWAAAVECGVASDEAILAALVRQFRLPLADFSRLSPQAAHLVPEALARKLSVVPLVADEGGLEVATADPRDMDCERTLAFATGRRVRVTLAAPREIARLLDEVYGAPDARGVTAAAEQQPVVRLLDEILADAADRGASDVHVEFEEGAVGVRYRIDGVLRLATSLPRGAGIPLV
jgi:type II secretory ATPase GspE/PulE/Tfp pilus assembly ATPase PilB-like protein